jgi:hypothetical protein
MRVRELIGMTIRIPLAAAAGVLPFVFLIAIPLSIYEFIPGWIAPAIFGLVVVPIVIWGIVRLTNRKDDSASQTRPPDPP